MWFNRKPKNRRFERKHVLDVKLRSSQRRQRRFRRVTVGLSTLLLTGIICFGAWRGGEAALRYLLYENPAFAIHHLDVETDGVISREQIRRWAGVKLEDNLLSLDLERVKRDLELVPVIQSAAVERLLPHTLKIRVTEREPIARFFYPRLHSSGIADRGTCLIDAQGMIMNPLEPHQRAVPSAATTEGFPILIGIPASELRPGRRVESPQLRAALQLIQAFERSPMAEVVELKEVDLSVPGVLQATTTQDTELTFGFGDPSVQLRRWRAVHDHVRRVGKHVAWIDLSVSNNVPARLVEATFAPPSPRKPSKPSRKRHV
ncbi:MAG: FtsQ-type POTRA domain-containing protein [Verrucomicrobia subdivision 3 bacterium]|nr:FtsQ-type POTRA domain-containing protein [Limisphaerales bacterium]